MNFDDYKNYLPYPNKPVRKCADCGHMFKEKDKYCSQCGNAVFAQYLRKLDTYELARKIYFNKEKELIEKFKEDAIEEIGLDCMPMKLRDRIFDFAWDKGHSAGLQEVYSWLENLYELLEEDI